MSIRPQQEVPIIEPSAISQHKWTVRGSVAIVSGIVALVIVAGLGWWLISPLFFHNTGHDNNSLANAKPVATTVHTGIIATASTSVAISPTIANGPVILATGKFIDTGGSDHGSGNVAIGKTSDGNYVIHLEQLNITNGPNLHVYLVTEEKPSTSQVTTRGIDLGSLSARQGVVNINIPSDVGNHLKDYRSVVIYCKTYAVIFTISPLQFSSAG